MNRQRLREGSCRRNADTAKQGTPKKDGSGGGSRKNKGRNGCDIPKKKGKGK